MKNLIEMQAWEAKVNSVKCSLKANERTKRLRVMQLKNQQPQPVANPIVDNNAVPEQVIRAKAEFEREDIIKKLNELKKCLKKIANVSDLDNYEIIRFFKESLLWMTTYNDLNKNELELKKMVVMYPLEDDKKVV